MTCNAESAGEAKSTSEAIELTGVTPRAGLSTVREDVQLEGKDIANMVNPMWGANKESRVRASMSSAMTGGSARKNSYSP